MVVLLALLVLNAVLHVAVVVRFGLQGQVPFAVFAAIYAGLALAVWQIGAAALWPVVILTALGLTGLVLTFNRAARDKSLDRAIAVLDVASLVLGGALLVGVTILTRL